MKNYHVTLGTESTTVNASNELEAAKKAILEFMPDDSKATEKEFQESGQFPESLDVLVQDYKDSEMPLTISEVNLKFTDNQGNLNWNIELNFQDLEAKDLAFILDKKVNCTLKTSNITNTAAFGRGVTTQFNTPAFASNPKIISEIIAVSFGGFNDAKSQFNTFLLLMSAIDGKAWFKNSEVNDVDCDVLIKF